MCTFRQNTHKIKINLKKNSQNPKTILLAVWTIGEQSGRGKGLGGGHCSSLRDWWEQKGGREQVRELLRTEMWAESGLSLRHWRLTKGRRQTWKARAKVLQVGEISSAWLVRRVGLCWEEPRLEGGSGREWKGCVEFPGKQRGHCGHVQVHGVDEISTLGWYVKHFRLYVFICSFLTFQTGKQTMGQGHGGYFFYLSRCWNKAARTY